MEVTIHRALSELKMIDKKIDRKISEFTVLSYTKNNSNVVDGITLSEFEKKITGEYDSITSLIERRTLIKKLIQVSNTTTKIKLAGNDITVAEAILLKEISGMVKTLDNKITGQIRLVSLSLNQSNRKVDDQAFDLYQTLLGDKAKDNIDEKHPLIKEFIENNKVKFVDPLKFVGNIEKSIDDRTVMAMEIDAILSESNSITTIDI